MTENIFVLVFLLLNSITDIRKKKVNIGLAAVFVLLAAILIMTGVGIRPLDALLGTLIGIAMLGLSKLTGEKIGYGDGIVIAVTGLFLGLFSNFVLICITSFLSGVFGIVLMLFKKADKNTEIPMAPFMAAAMAVMML